MHPEAKVELWTQDEHRVGLQPVSRRAWVPKDKKAILKTRIKYEWIWLYAYLNPEKGEVFWLTLPTVNLELFNLSLKEFAKHIGVSKEKVVILVIDSAGFHSEKSLELPEGLYVEYLPAYSPELQPAERLWPLTNEGIANEYFETIEELEQRQVERCLEVSDMEEYVSGLTNFHWWPEVT